MPHVVTQPAVLNTNMLNRSNSAASDSSFVPRTPVRTKTAGGTFGSFFGWGASATPGISSTDEKHTSLAEHRMSKVPSNIDITLANSQPSHPKRTDSGISLPPRTPMTVEETLEEELRIISADLAASIRRELDLEDLVESLQATAESQGRLTSNAGKRTSDYFSDAGTGSSGYDSDLPSKEQFDYDRIVRKSEQDRVQIRLELTQKIQDERQRRKGVELQVRELEERVDSTNGPRASSPGRIRDLEIALDDARRKLSEERNLKANFEDLVKAIRDELHGYRNERDNLRDEVVPQLRARVEGLEAELAESQKTPYEATKLQQEIDDLREKNAQLMKSNRQVQIAVETKPSEQLLSPAVQSTPVTPSSNLFKDRESLLERLKEIEAQRDALQLGLRNLRIRCEMDGRKAAERIRNLQWEKDRALRPSYRKMRQDKGNVAFRGQIERLRQRSENAVDSKYVCERNLASLRLDLDRCEQELVELRGLLREQEDRAGEMTELQESCKQLLAQSEGNEEIEQLAAELRSRSVVNAMLQKRLVDAIEKGEQDRLMANSKINAFCEMLKSMEEKIGDAQQDLEEAALDREQQNKDLKDTRHNSLRRIDENSTLATTQPRSSVAIAGKRPNITRDGSKSKDTRIYILQHRVDQLEKAIASTDVEMEDLESRLNVTLLEASELRIETQQSSQETQALRRKLAAFQS
ncbi:hypothetical protein DRE_02128 [Drechslerella stenobrocha 248]|uniref:DUF7603 domain-containing protein n=1 Tax=Drechslerella stenobrocha 248 TaxID=1043628 RepID=W7HXV9_9PEZI|nr:hypothetical protein DRE_02128 [Drechslerella stenobrocha 248]